MPSPRPVAGVPAPAIEAVASAWLRELLARAPLAAAPAIAGEDFVARAPAVVRAVVAGLSADVGVAGPEAAGEALARLAAPLPPGGPAAVVTAGEALRRALAGALAPALAAAPEVAGPLHDRLAWVVAELVQAALAEPELTDARPRWTVLVEVDDLDRLVAAGGEGALAAAGHAVEAALPGGARCVEERPGRWRVTGVGGASAGAGGAARPAAVAAALADAVAAIEGPHGVALRAGAGAGATVEEAEERLLAARAAGVRALP